MPASDTLLLTAGALLSIACLSHMWLFREGSIVRKAAWSVALLVPVLGPLFYAGLYRLPSKQDELLRAANEDSHTGM